MRDGDQILLDLRRAGLSYQSISIATRLLLGWHMTPEQVRYQLRRNMGVPADPSRARVGAQNPNRFERKMSA